METMELNGKKYVAVEDVEKEYEYRSNAPKFKFISRDFSLMDESNVLAVGSVQVGSDYVVVCRLSTEYLERVIKCLKVMSCNKDGLQSVDLAWGKDQPAIIGITNDKGMMSGFIIAPTSKNEP